MYNSIHKYVHIYTIVVRIVILERESRALVPAHLQEEREQDVRKITVEKKESREKCTEKSNDWQIKKESERERWSSRSKTERESRASERMASHQYGLPRS